MLVGEVMTRSVATAPSDATVQDVARLMRERDAGVVVLVGDDAPVALITARDLAVSVVAEARGPGEPALVHASSPVVAAEASTDAAEAAERMIRHGIRRLAVVEQGRLAGLVALDHIAAATGDAALAGRR